MTSASASAATSRRNCFMGLPPFGRRAPHREHYTAPSLIARSRLRALLNCPEWESALPPPPPPSPRYRSRHHNHKGNRRRAPFPLRPFAGVPAAPPARSQIDAYGIGRRRSCELHHGKPSFHAGVAAAPRHGKRVKPSEVGAFAWRAFSISLNRAM